MRRREFIEIVTALAATWPLAAHAQPTNKIARIGFLGSATAAGSAQSVRALREGLKALGYVEGKNIVIEFRWAEGKYERLPELVADLDPTPSRRSGNSRNSRNPGCKEDHH